MDKLPRINPINPKLGGNISKWLLLGGGILLLLFIFLPRPSTIPELEISQVIQLAQDGQLAEIEVRGDQLDVTTTSGEVFQSRKESGVSILELLDQRGIATGADGIQINVKEEGGSFFGALLSFLPVLIFGGLIFYMMRRNRGGINQALGIGKSQARLVENRPSVTFDDVAGADEAKRSAGAVVLFVMAIGVDLILGSPGDQAVEGVEQRLYLLPGLALDGLGHHGGGGFGDGAAGAFETDVGHDILIELQVQGDPVPAQGVVALQGAVGPLQAAEVAGLSAVVQDDLLVQLVDVRH